MSEKDNEIKRIYSIQDPLLERGIFRAPESPAVEKSVSKMVCHLL